MAKFRGNERVTIEEVSRVADGGGGYSETWASIASTPATVWAEVRPLKGRERVEAAQLESSYDVEVRIRRRGDLDAAMRLKWVTNGNTLLNIRSIEDPGPRGDVMVLYCEAGVAT